MNNKKIYSIYLLPTLLQIIFFAAIAGLFKKAGFELGYHSFLGMLLIVLAGISSAMWGVIYQKNCHGKSPLEILKEFFDVRQPMQVYLFVIAFLVIDFGAVIIGNGFKIGSIGIPFLFFLKALVFGGIEEIGWRYSFQPDLEKKFSYALATIITFICWGIWHILFFYIDGSLTSVNLPSFLLGLLTNSFILSALFVYSKSLWICAMTHALINTFSQISVDDSGIDSIMLKVVCMCFALALAYTVRKKRQKIPASEAKHAKEFEENNETLHVYDEKMK